jgi:hypothetical protein
VDYDAYVNRTYNIIKSDRFNLQYLTALLNSHLVAYWLFKRGKLQGEQYQVDVNPIMSVPIAIDDDQEYLSKLASEVSEANKLLLETDKRFKQLVMSELGLNSWSAKLGKWWKLNFEEFVGQLGRTLSLQQKDDLLELFNKYSKQLTILADNILVKEENIDERVYSLYNLTSDEIRTIENSLKSITD